MTRIRGMFVVGAVVAVCASQASCDLSCFGEPRPTKVSVLSPGGALWVGDSYTIRARGGVTCNEIVKTPEDWSSFTFSTDQPAVAKVSERGLVTAIGPGTASIFVAREGAHQSVEYTVNAPIASVEFTLAPEDPQVGETVTISLTPRGFDGKPVDHAKFANEVRLIRDAGPMTIPLLAGESGLEVRFQVPASGTFQLAAVAARLIQPVTFGATLVVP